MRLTRRMQFWQPFRKFFTGKLKFFSINVLKCLEKKIFCCNKNTSADPTGHLKRSSGNIADFFSTKGQQIFAQFRKLEKKAKLFQIDMFLKRILWTCREQFWKLDEKILKKVKKFRIKVRKWIKKFFSERTIFLVGTTPRKVWRMFW